MMRSLARFENPGILLRNEGKENLPPFCVWARWKMEETSAKIPPFRYFSERGLPLRHCGEHSDAAIHAAVPFPERQSGKAVWIAAD
jgi:hypothetical protein